MEIDCELYRLLLPVLVPSLLFSDAPEIVISSVGSRPFSGSSTIRYWSITCWIVFCCVSSMAAFATTSTRSETDPTFI